MPFREDGPRTRNVSPTLDRANKIAAAKMLLMGRTQSAIASGLKIAPALVEHWVNSDDEFKQISNQLLDGALEEAKKVLSRGAVLAAQALVDSLSSNSETAKVNAAKEILNRTGLPAVEKQEITQLNRFSSMDDSTILRQIQDGMRLLQNTGGGIMIDVPSKREER